MRMINFAKRNFKELIRDPLSLVFEIVLPLFLLFIFQQFDIPADNYRLENFRDRVLRPMTDVEKACYFHDNDNKELVKNEIMRQIIKTCAEITLINPTPAFL